MKKFRVLIKGTRPLLQHKPSVSQTVSRRVNVPATDPETFLYKDNEGRIYEPADHLQYMLRDAAKSFRIPGQRKTFKDLMFMLDIQPECIIHRCQEWVADDRLVKRKDGNRIQVVRPKFERWELEFTIETDETLVPEDAVRGILEYGGKLIGIGAYRQKFGRFVIDQFEEVLTE